MLGLRVLRARLKLRAYTKSAPDLDRRYKPNGLSAPRRPPPPPDVLSKPQTLTALAVADTNRCRR
uniref:Uncharacterized protein n=1 Tax=Leersia perrieri TaxID=77586 RepID=A0A0D9V587_9ORYZ